MRLLLTCFVDVLDHKILGANAHRGSSSKAPVGSEEVKDR